MVCKTVLVFPLFLLLYVHVYAIFVEVLCFFFGLQVSYTLWYRGTLTVTMNIYIFICNHRTKYNIEKNAQFGTSFVAYLSIEG